MFAAGMLASAAEAANYRGDFNHDSQLDMRDMVALARAIKSGNHEVKAFDLNADGVVDERDLDALANMILSQTLTEDNGVNVGIGNWGDGGEWGGTVGDLSRSRFSEEAISFRPTAKVYFKDRRTFIDSYLEEAEPISGLLFDIGIPTMLSDIKLDEAVTHINDELSYNHRLYGKVYKSLDSEAYLLHYRFIIFSPDLEMLTISDKPLFSFNYLNFEPIYGDDIMYKGCQAVLPDSGEVVDIGETRYSVHWEYKTLTNIWIEKTEVIGNPGEHIIIPFSWSPEEIQYFNHRISSSDEGAAEASVDFDKREIDIFIKESRPSVITLRALDDSDIEREIYVNKFTEVELITDNEDGVRAPVYTTQGVCIGILAGEDLCSLPPGLYIRNGKKLHIKR